jgi:hypothetical protein
VERNDARDPGEYTKKLQVRLEEIHAFWKSKSHEINCRAADQELGSPEGLEPDDLSATRETYAMVVGKLVIYDPGAQIRTRLRRALRGRRGDSRPLAHKK